MKILMRKFALAGFILFALSVSQVSAQSSATPDKNVDGHATATDVSSPSTEPTVGSAAFSKGDPICGITHLVRCIQDLGEDEKGIFTSPLRVHPKEAYWLMPLGAATGLAFAYDADAAQAAGVDASRSNIAKTITDFGSFYATGAESAGIYFVGLARKNPKLAETGRLGAEAILDSGTVALVTKLASNRQRPLQGNGRGNFWANGTSHWEFDSSFPSDHATASMALARVIAGEYPHWYVALPAYGFAESIGISRILANQHFPSDVLVGQAIGFLSGSYVLNHRALFRPGAKRTLTSKLIDSVNPITDPRTHTVGASIEVPLGR